MVKGNWSPYPLGRGWGIWAPAAGSRGGSGEGQQQPQCLWGDDWTDRGCSHCCKWHDARGIRSKMKQERFRLKIRRNSFTMRIAKHWAGCPKRLCSFHPWRFSKTYWIKLRPAKSDCKADFAFSMRHLSGLETFLDPFQRKLFCNSAMCIISTHCYGFTFWYCRGVGKGNNWKDLPKTMWTELWCTHELSGSVNTVHQHIQLQFVDHFLRYVRYCLLWSFILYFWYLSPKRYCSSETAFLY